MACRRTSLGRALCAALLGTFVSGVACAADAPPSKFVPAGYVLVFGDEFDGNALDTSKWWTRFVYDGPEGPGTLDFLKDERQRYRENRNHVVDDGVLKLTARKTSSGTTYESGMIRSKKTMKYGYFEFRAKMPRGRGVFPAGWLNPSQQLGQPLVWPPEVDIFEFVFNGGEELPDMIHSNVVVGPDQAQGGQFISSDSRFNKQWYYYKAPFRFTDDFHVFGALWNNDDTISIYIDGKLIQKRAYKWTNPSAVPGFAHVLVNLAIGGDWAGRYGIDDSAFPQALEVDYVRVYQRADAMMMGDDTRGNPKLCAEPAEC